MLYITSYNFNFKSIFLYYLYVRHTPIKFIVKSRFLPYFRGNSNVDLPSNDNV